MAWLSATWAATGAILALATLSAAPAHGMTFESRAEPGFTAVFGAGRIEAGDGERFQAEIILAPRGTKVVLFVTSGGGSVLAGENLASVIKRYNVTVVVAHGDVCASACFLLFAASPDKYASPTARIGVHSASGSLGETARSMAVTTAMARSASDLGVPAAIVGRMVTTAPGEMAWLTRAELASIGTTFLDPPASAAPPAAPAPPLASVPAPAAVATLPAAPTPAKPGTVPKDEAAPSFIEGRASRTAWEQWFATLSGDARLGAEFWTAERSKRRPAECAGSPEFMAGCTTAKQRLTGPDIRRKTDAQYWWGWNSL